MIASSGKSEDITRFKSEYQFDGEVYVDSNETDPQCYKELLVANGFECLVVHQYETSTIVSSTTTSTTERLSIGDTLQVNVISLVS